MTKPDRDVAPAPLFSPNAEARAMEALNVFIVVHAGDGSGVEEPQLIELRAKVTRLVDCLFPVKGERADFTSSGLVEGSDYIHPIKVAELAAIVGRTMGMPRSALISLAMSAALMNVGYLTLRRSLLDEPRRLLEGEWEQHVHSHPDHGVTLLAKSGLGEECLQAVGQHHERWDGSGYPGRVRGTDIVRDARILAVADSYVSLRSLRPYRQAVDADEALREIAGGSGKLFDPQVVEAFEEVIACYTGISRPERAASASAQTIAPASSESHEVQRNGIDRADDPEATGRPSPGVLDDAVIASAPASTRRSGVEAEDPGSAGSRTASASGRSLTPPAGSATRATPDTTIPGSVRQLAATPPRPAARLSRNPARQRRRPRPTLFSTRYYIDAAIRGFWAFD